MLTKISTVLLSLSLVACSQATKFPADYYLQTLGDDRVYLETLYSVAQQNKGLMHRSEPLTPSTGLLFVYSPAQQPTFWAKNVKHPFDIVWVGQGGLVLSVQPGIKPCTTTECKKYPAPFPVTHVVELASGRAAELGIFPGTSLKFVKITDK